MIKHILRFAILAGIAHGLLVFAEDDKVEFKKSVPLAPADHMILDVTVPKGDVSIQFRHAGEITVTASATTTDGKDLPNNFFETSLKVERQGNHLKVTAAPSVLSAKPTVQIAYQIGVPDWIEVNSVVEKDGNQTIAGVRGPVKVESGHGNIKILYVTTTLDAKTGSGNITVTRVGTAARVETGAGNIKMNDIGPASSAIVKKGHGRIEMDGVSGSFTGSTDAGELVAQGAVFEDWNLTTVSGKISIAIGEGEGGEEPKFNVDAITQAGLFTSENEYLKPCRVGAVHECHQKVNGGGKVIHARSQSGDIFIH